MKLMLLALAVPATLLSQAIPPKPVAGQFTHDLAGMLDAEAKQGIAAVQKTAYEQHDVPLIVVTIRQMNDYDVHGKSLGPISFEDFAKKWFNAWQIGTLQRPGKPGANKGILLLVSQGDRRARIELGADWGRAWDGACQRVMDSAIIPRFKEGSFARGIADGCEGLGAIAAIGPAGEPPGPGWGERLLKNPDLRNGLRLSLFPPGWVLLLLGLGAAMVVASFFFPDYRKLLLMGGIGVIVVALFTWIVIIIVVFLTKGRSGSFGSSGGFSGGFSGGGGASGSW